MSHHTVSSDISVATLYGIQTHIAYFWVVVLGLDLESLADQGEQSGTVHCHPPEVV